MICFVMPMLYMSFDNFWVFMFCDANVIHVFWQLLSVNIFTLYHINQKLLLLLLFYRYTCHYFTEFTFTIYIHLTKTFWYKYLHFLRRLTTKCCRLFSLPCHGGGPCLIYLISVSFHCIDTSLCTRLVKNSIKHIYCCHSFSFCWNKIAFRNIMWSQFWLQLSEMPAKHWITV